MDLICTSPFYAEKLFDGFEDLPVRSVIPFRNFLDLIRFIPRFINHYDAVYIDYFGNGRKHFWLAHGVADLVVCNQSPKELPEKFKSKHRFVAPKRNLHEASQYMRFIDAEFSDDQLREDQFSLLPITIDRRIEGPYITLQPGAGNNQTPWKTWPTGNWLELIEQLIQQHPNHTLVVLGDQYDEHLSGYLERWKGQIVNLINRTELKELPSILQGASLHIGSDSGLLHIAGVVGTPTVCIVGGSDPSLFGWHKVHSKHRIVQHELACHPCYRWYLPNRNRVEHASECPDFKCITSISTNEVFNSISAQLKQDD